MTESDLMPGKSEDSCFIVFLFSCRRSVIVNGQVEVVKKSGERLEYKLGDSFGAEPVPTVQFHEGDMITLVPDCEFVLVEHRDFCAIMSSIDQHIEKDTDGLTGEVVSETERRSVGNQVLFSSIRDFF